ncbi:MAG: hypothetical protein ACKO3P_24350 [Planctomycetaceae bacterium]
MNPRFDFDKVVTTGQADRAGVCDEILMPADLLPGLLCAPSAPRDADESRIPTWAIDGLFVPEGYEESYAYPLLVWLSTVPVSGPEFADRMRLISDRNHLGVSIPISEMAEPAEIEAQVIEVVTNVRRALHVHSERVVLVGQNHSALPAIEIALRNPDWFHGVIALGGQPPQTARLFGRFGELRGLRVLLAGSAERREPQRWRRLERELWSAGCDVQLWSWLEDTPPTERVLRQIDRWMMVAIERESTVWV